MSIKHIALFALNLLFTNLPKSKANSKDVHIRQELQIAACKSCVPSLRVPFLLPFAGRLIPNPCLALADPAGRGGRSNSRSRFACSQITYADRPGSEFSRFPEGHGLGATYCISYGKNSCPRSTGQSPCSRRPYPRTRRHASPRQPTSSHSAATPGHARRMMVGS